MALESGTKLGHYEITDQIGKGGMGEVYRARDTKLGREVAIKTLPDEFAQDEDRVARLQREAKLLASLNHPNIAAIHGLEESRGKHFLVLELIEGDTIADRVKSGPIPVEESLKLALQIAEALEAAHEKGVIHRDLKPANIKITPEGEVKVLDFGLAKAMENAGSVAISSEAPTITTPAMTEAGVILGTAAYMSPEQARGRQLDKRTDIWSFAALVYEMLTGARAFPGEDVTETLAAVVKVDPDWDILPDSTPPLVVAFLRRCLDKDPGRRVHDIADVRLALEGAYELPSPGVDTHMPGRARSGPGTRVRYVIAALALVVSGALGSVYWIGEQPVISIRQLTHWQGSIGGARVAPDGQVVVFGAAVGDEPYRLFQTRLDGEQSRPMDLPPADVLSLSPEGTLALAMGRPVGDGWLPRGVWAEAALDGGAPRQREDDVVGIELAPDGEVAAVVRRVQGESQVEFPVGNVVHRSTVIGSPRLSPDGNRICFPSGYRDLMMAEAGGEAVVLASPVPRANSCVWSPDGDEVWFTYSAGGDTHENIEAVNLDGDRRTLASFLAFAEIKDVSPDGRVVVGGGSLRYSAHGSAAGDPREHDMSIFNATRVVQLSADGNSLLLVDDSAGTATGGSQGGGVFLRPMDGSLPVPLGEGRPLAVTSDGQTIAVLGDGSERIIFSDRITLVPAGVGDAVTIQLPIQIRYSDRDPIGVNPLELRNPEFSDDGRRILLPFGSEPGAQPRVWIHDFEEQRTWPVTVEGVTGPVVMAPDGRFVASNESEGLFIYGVDDETRREAPGGADPGDLLRWSSDPDVIFVREQDGAGAIVYARDISTGERTMLMEVRAPDPAGLTRFDLHLSREGTAYAYSLDRWLTNLFVLENIN